jgi:HEAT repeat protein
MKIWIALIILTSLAGVAQSGPPASSAQATPSAATADGDDEPDVPVAKPAEPPGTSVEEQTSAAWNMLSAALSDTKTQAQQARIDAITVLGTLGDFPVAQGWLRDAEKDQDRYIRLAAVAAMGSSKKTAFVPDLKHALNDSAAEVSFAAAVGLWKMNDKSGEDILDAVLAGDRKANRGLVTAEKHEANQDLHSSSKLAAIGAEQGAYALLGPFGFGLSAVRMRKGQSGIQPRVIAASLLAEDASTASMKKFIDALDDPDPSVRAAGARALGDYHGKDVTDALSDAFYDLKPAVRFMAAASYIRATHPQAENKEVRRRKTTAATSSTHQRSTTPARITQ